MEEKDPDELVNKHEVVLLYKASGLQHTVLILTIYGYVLGNQPLGSLSHYPFPIGNGPT